MATVAVMLGLVLLHGPGGGDIWINPQSVTTMHAPRPGQPNKHVTQAARCLLNTSDGKFVSVIETCDEVRAKFQGR